MPSMRPNHERRREHPYSIMVLMALLTAGCGGGSAGASDSAVKTGGVEDADRTDRGLPGAGSGDGGTVDLPVTSPVSGDDGSVDHPVTGPISGDAGPGDRPEDAALPDARQDVVNSCSLDCVSWCTGKRNDIVCGNARCGAWKCDQTCAARSTATFCCVEEYNVSPRTTSADCGDALPCGAHPGGSRCGVPTSDISCSAIGGVPRYACTGICGGGPTCFERADCCAASCGSPALSAGPGIVCQNRCVEQNADSANCGGCGNVCPANSICAGGQCSCQDPFQPNLCGDPQSHTAKCTNVGVDPDNCGTCDNRCPATAKCQDGLCQCPAGQRLSSKCCTLGLDTDPANCGTCGNRCASGSICTNGSCAPPTPVAISGARGLWCAIIQGGQVKCWGGNENGGLGDGAEDQPLTPVSVVGLKGAKSISIGWEHGCALLTDGTASCWGRNGAGELGNGMTTGGVGTCYCERTPVTVRGLSGAIALASGESHTCALMADGTVKCWGRDSSLVNSLNPTAVTGVEGATAIAAGSYSTCVLLAGGTVRCWGGDARSPTPIIGVSQAIAIAVADPGDVCVLLPGGSVACGQATNKNGLTMVPGLTGAMSITTSQTDGCAVMRDGTAQCWTLSRPMGQVVVPSMPKPVPGLKDATAIVALGGYWCALASGTAQCWGPNPDGYDPMTPVPVKW
jgi:hypothetical protein